MNAEIKISATHLPPLWGRAGVGVASHPQRDKSRAVMASPNRPYRIGTAWKSAALGQV